MKTRRIILGLLKRVEAGEREAARREIALTELSAQVDELEFQRDEARRSAGDRPLDDGPQSHPDP